LLQSNSRQDIFSSFVPALCGVATMTHAQRLLLAEMATP